jgi:hypothetical protein
MNYTFSVDKIICHQPLGSYDGILADGLRFYYIIGVNDRIEKIISGDGVYNPNLQYDTDDSNTDSIFVRQGTIIELPIHKPRQGEYFESTNYNIQPDDKIEIILIGINEGVAYAGGGGGTWNEEFKKLVKEIMSKLGSEGKAIGEGFGMFIDFISEHYNNFDECKGNIFTFHSEMSGIQLMEATSLNRTKQIVLNSKEHQLPMYFRNESKPPACNIPNYDIYFSFKLQDKLLVDDSQISRIHIRSSDFETFLPKIGMFNQTCKRENLQIQYLYYKNEITIKTNFNFSNLPFFWEINGIEINQSTSIQLQESCYHPTNVSFNDLVPLDIIINNLDGHKIIKISSNYQLGDFSLDVKLRIKFPNITKTFYERNFDFDIIEIKGNKEYNEYIKCVEANTAYITRISEKFSTQIEKIKKPLDPISLLKRDEIILKFQDKIKNLGK